MLLRKTSFIIAVPISINAIGLLYIVKKSCKLLPFKISAAPMINHTTPIWSSIVNMMNLARSIFLRNLYHLTQLHDANILMPRFPIFH